MDDEKSIAVAILGVLDWVDREPTTDFEKGVVMGLKFAQSIAELIEKSESNGK